jgi:acyl dehydratase
MSAPMSTSAVPSAPVALSEGDELSVTVGPLTRTDFVRYAGASGDFHPLHHDETYAVGAGFPSVFGMGLLHAGILGVQLARWVGPDSLRAFGVRFTGQVWPGDELTLAGRVERIEEADGVRLAHLALRVTRQNGEDVIGATATAVVR